MAIQFDSHAMLVAASIAAKSEKEYVRRYAARVQHAVESIPSRLSVGNESADGEV